MLPRWTQTWCEGTREGFPEEVTSKLWEMHACACGTRESTVDKRTASEFQSRNQ